MRHLLPVLLLIISGCCHRTDRPRAATAQTIPVGVVDGFHSTLLNEDRVLDIYLPPDYKASDTTHFPVIYLLDGGADQDFIHIAGLVQYSTLSWVNRMPESIVVGIANTDRKRDFTFPSTIAEDKKLLPTSGGSARFIAFIEQELQPYINAHYRTTASRTIIGQSLGGLVATEILFYHTPLFSKYVIISPSLWWNNGSLLRAQPPILTDSYSTDTRIFIAVGTEGLAPVSTNHVMEVEAQALATKVAAAASQSLHTGFEFLKDENHATITHEAVYRAIRFLYPERDKAKQP